MAKIATTSVLLDSESSKPGVMIERGLAAIEEAANWKPDLVLLMEEIDIVGQSPEESAKGGGPVPGGAASDVFSQAAKKYETNIVVGLRERDGDVLYNTGAVFDRSGGFVGKYWKTHLAPGESAQVSAGDDYPVFDMDFGKLGVTICMDIHYPEVFTTMALQGADVIANISWWRDYTGDLMESIVNARAIDNQVYIVTSHPVTMPFLTGGAFGHARIVDPYGRTRATTSHRPGVAVAEVDLDEAYEYWATGELKQAYPTLKECFLGMRRPETYGVITRSDTLNSWRIKDQTLYAPVKPEGE
jgi:predicted amidohydrolase